MKTLFLFNLAAASACVGFAFGAALGQTPKTPSEETAFVRYSQADDVAAFLSALDAASPRLAVRVIGRSAAAGACPAADLLLCVLSEEGAQEFLKLCPHAEYVNVTNAAHMVAGDRNDIFGNAILDFLSRVVPAGRDPVQPAHATHPHREGPPGDVNDVP